MSATTTPAAATTIAAYFAAGSEMTANECLAALGMTKARNGYGFDYFDASGRKVLHGSVHAFNDWLRAGMPVADGGELPDRPARRA